MPYAPEHRQRTRERILDAARRVFRLKGFAAAGIDEIMAEAGLTRGGFYAHFANKDALFAAAIGDLARPADLPQPAGTATGRARARAFAESYLSSGHRRDLGGGCTLAALSPEIARAGPATRAAFTTALAEALAELAALFGDNDGKTGSESARAEAVALLALNVGGLALSRAVADESLAEDILESCRKAAIGLIGPA